MKKILLIVVSFFILLSPVFGADTNTTPVPYNKEEIPLWVQDLRRTEIISFGALPFVSIGVALGYGSYQYFSGNLDEFPNPLDKSTNPYTENQQKQMFAIAAGISVGIGLTDLVINLIKRSKEKKNSAKNDLITGQVVITPVSDEELSVIKQGEEELYTEIEVIPYKE